MVFKKNKMAFWRFSPLVRVVFSFHRLLMALPRVNRVMAAMFTRFWEFLRFFLSVRGSQRLGGDQLGPEFHVEERRIEEKGSPVNFFLIKRRKRRKKRQRDAKQEEEDKEQRREKQSTRAGTEKQRPSLSPMTGVLSSSVKVNASQIRRKWPRDREWEWFEKATTSRNDPAAKRPKKTVPLRIKWKKKPPRLNTHTSKN